MEQNLIFQLQQQFPQLTFSTDNLTVVHKGRFANAIVYRYTDENVDLIIKDFQQSPWFIRQSFARLFINQEQKALTRLSDVTAVTNKYFRMSNIAIAYNYIEGTPLRTLVQQKAQLPTTFFIEFERMVAKMHRAGLVHLDLRNLGNILYGKDGKPYFIDFQSAITYRRYPRWLQRFMRGADMSGVYKAWDKLGEQPLPTTKRNYLTRYNKIRKRWIFKGYPLQRSYAWCAGLVTHGFKSETIRNFTDRM